MDDRQMLIAACKIVGCDENKVLKYGVLEDEDAVKLIVDRGIKGCPEYHIPLAKIVGSDDQEEETAEQPEPAINATRNAIAMAQEHGINLATVIGSSDGGRIMLRDVKNKIKELGG